MSQSRARAFGAISAAGGIGSAAGPLIGGLITSAASWRLAFGVQALLVGWSSYTWPPHRGPGRAGRQAEFDFVGAVLSAAGLFFVVVGILQAGTYGWFHPRRTSSIGSTRW